jgi:hypothetical protein
MGRSDGWLKSRQSRVSWLWLVGRQKQNHLLSVPTHHQQSVTTTEVEKESKASRSATTGSLHSSGTYRMRFVKKEEMGRGRRGQRALERERAWMP